MPDIIDELDQQEENTGTQTEVDETPDVEDSENLVPTLLATEKGREYLKRLGKRVVSDYERDLKSSAPYREMCAKALRLYLGMTGTVSHGAAAGSMEPCLPILSKVTLRIYHKVNSMVMQSDPVVVPTGDEDQERATRVSQHMSWERRAKHPEWQSDMQASIIQWILFGDMIRYIAWDPVANKKSIRYLSARDCVIPYGDKDSSPGLENVQRITCRLKLPRHKIEQLGDYGFYHGADELFKKSSDSMDGRAAVPYRDSDSDEDPIGDIVREREGEPDGSDSSPGPDAVYCMLDRHSWERPPAEVNPEKKLRRISAVVEKSSERVLRLVYMEREDPIDRRRYENELREFQIAAENNAAMMANHQREMEMAMQQGIDPSSIPAPMPQDVPSEPSPVRTEAVYPFVHYMFLHNPEGIYGVGAYTLSGQLNEIANTLFAEHIVASRLANTVGGFMCRDVDIKKGELSVNHGKFIGVDVPRGELQSSFMSFPFQHPDGNIMNIIEKLDQEAQSNISAHDSMSGAPGPSRETAAAAKIRQQNALSAITSAMEGFLIPLSYEYKQYARINALFLPETEYFSVVEPDQASGGNKRTPVKISRADYEADYDITFDADTRLELDPGLGQSAIQAYQMIMADPELQKDPTLLMRARKKALRAMKAPELAALLPNDVPPPPEPPPPQPMSQEQENAGFINEQDHPVLPDDDHVDHLAKMSEFEAEAIYAELSSTGKQLFDRHKRAHMAVAYLAATELGKQLGGLPNEQAGPPENDMGLPGEIGTGGLEQGPGNPAPFPGT